MKIIGLILGLGIFADFSAQTSLDTSLVCNYPFNGNANDIGPNAQHGFVNGATLTTDRFGNTNSAYSFDGINDFIDIGPYDSLLVPEYTYSVWVQLYSIPAIGTRTFIIYIGSENEQHISVSNMFSTFYNANGWTGYGTNSFQTSPFNSTFVTLDSTNLVPNIWKHIVLTRSSYAMRLYIDGVLKSVDSTNFITSPTYGFMDPMLSFSCNANIGTDSPFGSPNYFHGKIDDVRIYKRAINSSEVDSLHTATALGNTSIDFPVSQFKLSPNPSSGIAILNYNLNQYKNANFQLFDVQGKVVYQTELNTNDNKTILTLDKLDNGIYFGKIYADGILVKTEKIVKRN